MVPISETAMATISSMMLMPWIRSRRCLSFMCVALSTLEIDVSDRLIAMRLGAICLVARSLPAHRDHHAVVQIYFYDGRIAGRARQGAVHRSHPVRNHCRH